MKPTFKILKFALLVGWVLPLAVTLCLADAYWSWEVMPHLTGRVPLGTPINSIDFYGLLREAAIITVLWLAVAATTVAVLLRPAGSAACVKADLSRS